MGSLGLVSCLGGVSPWSWRRVPCLDIMARVACVIDLPRSPPREMLEGVWAKVCEQGVDFVWCDTDVLGAVCRQTSHAQDHEEMAKVAIDACVEVWFALLDDKVVTEDEIMEPNEVDVKLSWRPMFGRDDGQVTPGTLGEPGVSAKSLVAAFGGGRDCSLSGFSIGHSADSHAKRVWVGLMAFQVTCQEAEATSVDAHVTLFYCKDQIASRLRPAIAKMEARVAKWDKQHFGGIVCEQYAQDWYAWVDILVRTPLHAALHNLVAAGVGDGRGLGIRKKPAFHLSFRASRWTTLTQKVDGGVSPDLGGVSPGVSPDHGGSSSDPPPLPPHPPPEPGGLSPDPGGLSPDDVFQPPPGLVPPPLTQVACPLTPHGGLSLDAVFQPPPGLPPPRYCRGPPPPPPPGYHQGQRAGLPIEEVD